MILYKKANILKYQSGGETFDSDDFIPPFSNMSKIDSIVSPNITANSKRALYPFPEGTFDKKENNYEILLNSIIKKKGGQPSDYETFMNQIAFHESKYLVPGDEGQVFKYLDPKAKQEGGGPGRGLFMFEKNEGQGGITAVNRTYNYMTRNKLNIPDWLKEAYKQKSFDASTLTAEQQKMLFLGNYIEHGKANMGDVISGKQSVVDFWANYHQTQNDPNKIENFEDDLIAYNNKYSDGEGNTLINNLQYNIANLFNKL